MYQIVIADDHELVRDTIAAYLTSEADLTVQTAEDFESALRIIRGPRITHLAILDYNMAGMDGLKGISRLQAAHPDCRVILMSGVASPTTALEAMQLGADGFIPKSMSANSMINAIKFVLAGEKYFPAELNLEENTKQQVDFMGLTNREAQTLRLICKGLSNKSIAREMDIQEVTVKLHVKNILRKVGVSNRTQAALIAQSNGFK